MQLEPCDHCHRHVARASARCPFCHTALASVPARIVSRVGRVSRAAIFAGAAACGSSQGQQQPHNPAPPPPPDPVIVQRFATAPPPAAGMASVRGFVTVDGLPLTGVRVRARHEEGAELETTTGPKGEYAFVDIAPGHWQLVPDYEMPTFRPQDYVPPPSDDVMLAYGANQRHDIQIRTPPPPPPDTGPCCKPYGAPPARRRVV